MLKYSVEKSRNELPVKPAPTMESIYFLRKMLQPNGEFDFVAIFSPSKFKRDWNVFPRGDNSLFKILVPKLFCLQRTLNSEFSEQVEWCGGSETMEEILNRIQQREEAAARRERAMAYAFSHQARHLKRRFITIINCDYHYIALSIGNDSVNFLQWRANSSQYLGQTYYDLSKDNCGWSWKERWIAVRPWEKRVEVSSTMPKKVGSKQKTSKTTNLAKTNIIVSVKPHLSNGKDPTHARKNSSQTIMKQASPDANLE